ncbi:MAG TPA: PAS domain S-box protein [Solirubrobacteraceae bacterium]|nr:PAS domain S-box protein [Solirubrobacteraceae bacterium]
MTSEAERSAAARGPDQCSAETQNLAHVGSWELDLRSGRAVWSDELCRIFGRPVGRAPTWDEFIADVHPEDRSLVGRAYDDLQHGTATQPMRYRIRRPSGELRHIQARRHCDVAPDGTVLRMYGTMHDITDVQRAEDERREAQELFETAFAQAPIGMALVGLDGRWLKVNEAAARITGWSPEELLARTFQDVTHPDDLEADLSQIKLLLAGEINGYTMEKRYLTKAGAEIWVSLSVSLVRAADGSPRHFISQLKDISERKRADARLRQAEIEARLQRDYAQAIIAAMHDGYALTADGEIKAVNGALCELTGFAEEELVGARVPFPFWPPERMDETMTARRRVMAEEGGSFEVTLMRKNGERFEAEINAKAARDADGRVLGFVNTMRDVSVQRRQQAELERLARTDALTGLANRHVLQQALAEATARARRTGGQVALVLLDLDWFKQINDRYGHPAGDAVLVEVARRLGVTVRAGEVMARVGGEEFAWLLPGADLEDAIVAADRARAMISAQPFPVAGPLTMSAGVGVVCGADQRRGESTPELDPAEVVYRLADRALYEAKLSGRNRTRVLTAEPPA